MERAKSLIRDIPDFPKEGIVFKDITPVLADALAFAEVIQAMAERLDARRVDKVVGVEARGFIFGAAVARELGIGFVPVRKPGKLPYDTHEVSYELEYGTDTLEMHRDGVGEGELVSIVDDLLATGGTAAAAGKLVTQVGGIVDNYTFMVELGFLGGADRLESDVISLITY